MSADIDIAAGKAGLWYTVGNILLKGCVFLTLPIFINILSTEDFGIYNTYIAYEGLISAFLGMGLYGTVKNAKIDFKDRFKEYISSVYSMSVIFFIFIVIVANICFELYSTFLGYSRLVINCLLCQSFGAYFIHFYGIRLNTEFKYKSFLTISVFNTLGSVFGSIVLILFVFPNERYLGRIVGAAIIPFFITLIISIKVLLEGKTIYKKEYWSFACRIGLPLIPHVISQSVLSQFDRIMIDRMVGESEAGIYSYIYTVCMITNIIALSIDNAWTPWLFVKVSNNELEHVYKASKKYVSGFAVITIGFMCVMPEVARYIAREEYWSGLELIIPIALANYCVFLYLMPVSLEYYHKKTAFISFGTILASIVNILLNYIGINLGGYKAAAYTTLIAYLLLFIFHSIVASKYNYNNIFDIKTIFIITLIVFVIGLSLLLFSINYVLSICVRCVLLILVLIWIYNNKGIFFNIVKR